MIAAAGLLMNLGYESAVAPQSVEGWARTDREVGFILLVIDTAG